MLQLVYRCLSKDAILFIISAMKTPMVPAPVKSSTQRTTQILTHWLCKEVRRRLFPFRSRPALQLLPTSMTLLDTPIWMLTFVLPYTAGKCRRRICSWTASGARGARLPALYVRRAWWRYGASYQIAHACISSHRSTPVSASMPSSAAQQVSLKNFRHVPLIVSHVLIP